jgi:hypothetical protein
VFCFLPDPELHIRKLAEALKPGGLLAIQDYAHRESFALFPRPAEWLDFLVADRAMFAAYGGDISMAVNCHCCTDERGWNWWMSH